MEFVAYLLQGIPTSGTVATTEMAINSLSKNVYLTAGNADLYVVYEWGCGKSGEANPIYIAL